MICVNSSGKSVKRVPVAMCVCFVFCLLTSHFGFSQERFLMDQNTFEQFKKAKRLYDKGYHFFSKKKYSKAMKPLTDCVGIFPQYSEAYFLLAQMSYENKEYPAALDYIEKARDNYKFMADMRVATQLEYLDTLREQQRKLQENLSAWRDRLKSAGTAVDRREIESEIGKIEGELSQIQNRLSDPLPRVGEIPAAYYYVHGNILFKMKRYQDAHQQYLETVKVDPTHGNAYINLANLYYMIKKYERALFYLNKAEENGARVNPKFKEAVLKGLGK